jgi:hypothetical protein
MSNPDDLPELPLQTAPVALGDDITVLPADLPVPGLGRLAVNAFVFDGAEPLLVDTGLAALQDRFIDTLSSLCEPSALRWIWISHMDPDHTGNLAALLAAAPQATVLSSFLGCGKMQLAGLPVERVQVVEADVPVVLGDRDLLPLRPPYYDAPETLGFIDRASASLFVADAFGAVLPGLTPTVEPIPPSLLRDGLAAWSALDAPWLGDVRSDVLQRRLDALQQRRARRLLSSHLPSAASIEALCRYAMDASRPVAPTPAREAA